MSLLSVISEGVTQTILPLFQYVEFNLDGVVPVITVPNSDTLLSGQFF